MNRRSIAVTSTLVFLVGIALPATAVAQQKQAIDMTRQTIQQPAVQPGNVPDGLSGRGQVSSEEEEELQMRPRPDRATGFTGRETGNGVGSGVPQTPQEVRLEPGDNFAPGNR